MSHHVRTQQPKFMWPKEPRNIFPRQVHYVGFSDDEVEHGGKQKRDRSRCLKIMAPSF